MSTSMSNVFPSSSSGLSTSSSSSSHTSSHSISSFPSSSSSSHQLPLLSPLTTSLSSTPHSPLSPLTRTSPVYPDGLPIAPIWIRKHTMLVPAVFVLFASSLVLSTLSSTLNAIDTVDTKPKALIELPLYPQPPSSHASSQITAPGRARARWFIGGLADSTRDKGRPGWVDVPPRKQLLESGSGSGYESIELVTPAHPITLELAHVDLAYVGERVAVEVVVRGCSCGGCGEDGCVEDNEEEGEEEDDDGDGVDDDEEEDEDDGEKDVEEDEEESDEEELKKTQSKSFFMNTSVAPAPSMDRA
ncbi:hypothetical protein EV360DRAFT_88154 [Lentinula raphanica]|nr:hypothetical protein EV360DRAFT_88154 [Lentinula raphanica]